MKKNYNCEEVRSALAHRGGNPHDIINTVNFYTKCKSKVKNISLSPLILSSKHYKPLKH